MLFEFRWALVLSLAGMLQAVAGESDSHPCASVAEPAQRLACYDQTFPPPPSVHQAMTEKTRRDFGLDKTLVPPHNPGLASEREPGRIQGRVQKVEYDAAGKRTVFLDNDQVWMLLEATTRGHMAEGDEVSVRKGALGSYLLVTSAGVGLRARRIR